MIYYTRHTSLTSQILIKEKQEKLQLLLPGPLLLPSQHKPNSPSQSLIHRDNGPISQAQLGLIGRIEPRHARIPNHPLRQTRRLAKQTQDELRKAPDRTQQPFGQLPHLMWLDVLVCQCPGGMGHVPEVDGGVIGDVEGLAVDALMVQGGALAGIVAGFGSEEAERDEEVGVRDIADVGEVEEVVVLTELHAQDEWGGLGGVFEDFMGEGGVFFAVDTGGTDGTGHHCRRRGAVVLEDEVFCVGLDFR